MQTTLARRQRHRRLGIRQRPRGSSALKRTAIALPIILFVIFLGAGALGLLGVAAAYTYYANGLPNPEAALTDLAFDQQTIVTDRTGTIELAKLGERKRQVVTFAELTPEILDATTAIEDKDFWDNPGFDFAGFVSATVDTINGRPRGGSTITQQLVRARLLPPSAFDGSREERKIREIIQSVRLTQAYPGEKGKQQIITAYLNQNFYGNQSYGVKAAARQYFGKDLKDLTLAEAAILAAIPQSPTKFDLVKNAEQICDEVVPAGGSCTKSRLVVPADSEVVIRRNYILDRMKTESPLSGPRHSLNEYEAAKAEPVVLAPQLGNQWKAPQFVWQVRNQLATILCPGQTVDACEKIDTGGYHVTTTINMAMQGTTEKWVYAAARAPNLKGTESYLKTLKIPQSDYAWLKNLKGKNIHNGAAAVIDYRTGQILAYVGSASYTSPGDPTFQPQFDVLSDGWRQPGSSIKPIDYAIGIDDRTMTAATMFMDVVTDFGRGFTPTQADKLERGPVRLRSALQFSLNIPAIKAGIINGLDHFYQRAQDFGIKWVPGSGPVISMSIGTIEIAPHRHAERLRRDRRRRGPRPADDDPPGHRLERQRRLPRPEHPPGEADRGHQPPGGLHHHRHPRRQHEPQGQPVLGRVGGLRRPDPPAGRLQDRHDERQPRRPRVRLPGPAQGPEPSRPSRSGSGWATATTRPTRTRCRSPRRRRSGRGSCATSARTCPSRAGTARRGSSRRRSTRSAA